MDNRDLIGQAKGILIERYKIGEVEAFGLLVTSSQTVNRNWQAAEVRRLEAAGLGSRHTQVPTAGTPPMRPAHPAHKSRFAAVPPARLL